MLFKSFLALGLLIPSFAVAQSAWRADLDKGRQAFARQQYGEALEKFRGAEQAARAEGNDTALIESLRLLAAVLRESGDAAQAEQILKSAADEFAKSRGETSLELAVMSEELAALYRAQGNSQALALLDKAIAIRDAHPEAPRADLARDLSTAAALRQQAGQNEQSIELFKRAIQEWDTANPGDPRSLQALESLSTIYRDAANYADAEPLLMRALRLRETSSGPAHSEVISAVDSLAYVKFGLRKMPEAEALYKRLLNLWETNAGPDHPMVALTLDKMAEFYAFQQRYDEAEKLAAAALAIRTRVEVASLHQTGRLLIMQAKIPEAEDLYRRTIQIGDLAQAPDESMDPPLRVYAKILRELKRDSEAEPLEKRVKEALMKQPERPLPPSKPVPAR